MIDADDPRAALDSMPAPEPARRRGLPMCVLDADGVWREVRELRYLTAERYLPADGAVVASGDFVGLVPVRP